jgi:acetyl esterase/lipase
MMGFSAGGHLTAMAATMAEAGKPDAADPLDRVSSRPDFIVLGYPWLNAMWRDQKTGTLSYCSALKIDPSQCVRFEQYTPDRLVNKDSPAAFIYHTTDDELVPVEAAVTYYRAMVAAGAPAELHIFATGRHGSGLGLGDAALDAWPGLLEAWMRARKLLADNPAALPPPRPAR